MEFARRVSFITGRSYRLPTEKEWEYAAKGGNSPHGFDYAGSNNIDQVGWYISNTHNVTQPVGRKAACIGLYDMTGNVAEWSYDGDSSSRMIRGGSFVDPPTPYCLVTSRTGWSLDYRVFIIGFRLACSSD
jgi:formylglycine-generating enzyme required for sulfatase activity